MLLVHLACHEFLWQFLTGELWMLEWAYPTLLHNTFCKCSRFSVLGKLAFSQYSFIAKMRKIVLFDHIRLSCPFIFCRASFLSFASFSATACKCPSQVRLLQRLSRSIVADELDNLLFISEILIQLLISAFSAAAIIYFSLALSFELLLCFDFYFFLRLTFLLPTELFLEIWGSNCWLFSDFFGVRNRESFVF